MDDGGLHVHRSVTGGQMRGRTGLAGSMWAQGRGGKGRGRSGSTQHSAWPNPAADGVYSFKKLLFFKREAGVALRKKGKNTLKDFPLIILIFSEYVK